MKCFEQEKEFKKFSFIDDKGRKIIIRIDWSIHNKDQQFLNIDVLDDEKSDVDEGEIYATEINLNENYGYVANR